ncbi:hypothetical protein HEK616_00140 [Streptomyces nigrescens]|uniref:Integral membrane protein n=1 Tax=Streptomyces nigrescens TaxID=1920 RepID=A0ABN6QK21_STRNI|nr:hypothetical protein [Streptomyces nigrescens]BDM66527.1 hypothetical protein HEK616_00140 [Streptomyces nigrescens]
MTAGAGTGSAAGQIRDVWSGRAVLVSMAALLAEAMCVTVGVVLYGFTQEGPVGNVFLAAFVLPVALVLGALPGLVLTVTLVLPTLMLGRLAARWGGWQGRAAWWCTAAAAPFAVAGAMLVHGVCSALLTGSVGPPLVYLVCWPVLTAAVVPAALLAAVAARGTGTRRTVRLTVTVASGGFLAALAMGVLGVGALATGLLPAYEPPKLDRARLVGVWRDGSGGTLELRSDGTAAARGLSKPGDRCGGVGSWALDRFTADERLEVEVDGDCRGQWFMGGTEKRPTLYYFLGDPDEWHRHVLTRQVGRS